MRFLIITLDYKDLRPIKKSLKIQIQIKDLRLRAKIELPKIMSLKKDVIDKQIKKLYNILNGF